MGSAKHAMIQHQENLQVATAYLVRKGALEQCPYHDEIYNGGGLDLDKDFWAYAMADRKLKEKGPVPWAAAMEAREYTDLLKEAHDGYLGDECGYCAKNRDRD